MLRAIVLGPPGSGKGTQAKRLASKIGATHVSVGCLIRAEIANGSPIGRRAKAVAGGGDLVADEDVFAVLDAPLVEATRAGGWILDGIPRTVGQARALDEMLANMDATPQLIVALEIPADESAERLRQRGSVEDRPDDAEPVVAHRLALWAREGPPLLDWYERQKRLTRIDGRGDSITVEDRVWAMIHRANL